MIRIVNDVDIEKITTINELNIIKFPNKIKIKLDRLNSYYNYKFQHYEILESGTLVDEPIDRILYIFHTKKYYIIIYYINNFYSLNIFSPIKKLRKITISQPLHQLLWTEKFIFINNDIYSIKRLRFIKKTNIYGKMICVHNDKYLYTYTGIRIYRYNIANKIYLDKFRDYNENIVNVEKINELYLVVIFTIDNMDKDAEIVMINN